MSTPTEYLAIFLGDKTGRRRAAWDALTEEERTTKTREGIAAWTAWMQTHAAALAVTGGPLGKTLKVSPDGIESMTNAMSGFVVVRAESQEAAARMFVGHPHFAIFPGDRIELMPVLPVPAG